MNGLCFAASSRSVTCSRSVTFSDAELLLGLAPSHVGSGSRPNQVSTSWRKLVLNLVVVARMRRSVQWVLGCVFPNVGNGFGAASASVACCV